MKNFYIYIFLLIFGGCALESDVSFDKDSPNLAQDVKYDQTNFNELEEVYENINYDDAISEYTNKLPNDFKIIRFRYFVVFSNLNDSDTYQLIDNDIRNTVDAMLHNYIDVRPDEVTAIFLFKDKQNYKDFSVNEFGIDEDDLSPYGFFKIPESNCSAIRKLGGKHITRGYTRNDTK